MRVFALLFGICLASTALSAADAPPPVPGMEAVDDNGRSFLTPSQRLPLPPQALLLSQFLL